MFSEQLHIYTDGSCIKNNPKDSTGPGGWGFVIIDKIIFQGCGSDKNTTNNRMEIQAVISALQFCDGLTKNVLIHTDSMYVLNCAQRVWKRGKNLDLWAEYDKAAKDISITWKKVKAHNGDTWNEYVDKLANIETQKIKKYC